MAEKMLIDASHPEETRVVVVRGSRIEEFDFESQHKKQLRGNIYLAKVTRVEPSLQAAFVDYGGNRHGFLAFSEIHPDYYQIPLADRQALLQAEAEDARNDPDFDSADNDDSDAPAAKETEKSGKSRPRRSRRGRKQATGAAEAEAADGSTAEEADVEEADGGGQPDPNEEGDAPETMAAEVETDEISEPVTARRGRSGRNGKGRNGDNGDNGDNGGADDDNVESVGAEDALEELPERSVRKPRKQYRIQEVIKRRQILLVQVVKEERGNKGAALTTYLSLAGRYSVLMPNTARGGGISRKITNVVDRKRLKEIARELEVPQGMGVILRTAGANRTKVEIKRDFEYLMRLWENVRNLTLTSMAPCLVYEEGSLIKRSIRDLYNKEISEIVVSGEEGYREAKDFMKMLMPSHAKVVQPYREVQPIFARSGIESQLDRMLQPQVTLKSGGYIIINQTEALVAIDVNSGRSTREHSIEDTALQTNLEAAEEVARQLRLRDLAGLIVIDFIDMDENRNNRAVEKRIKDCLKHDRARIQVGRISHFGLLEMSRQRIRASVLESTMQVCPTCGGTGHIRSQSSVALHVLRGIEEYLLKNTTHNVTVRTTADTALYMLNRKRDTVMDLERRFGLSITFVADPTIGAMHFALDRGDPVENPVKIEHITAASTAYADADEDEEVLETETETEESPADAEAEAGSEEQREDGQGRKRRRRRRRGGRRQEGNGEAVPAAEGEETAGNDDEAEEAGSRADEPGNSDEQRPAKRRRRGKRGGRRNREDESAPATTDGTEANAEEAGSESIAVSAEPEAVSAEAPETPGPETPGPETASEATSPEAGAAETDAGEEPEKKAKPVRRRRTKAVAKEAEAEIAPEPAAEPDAKAVTETAEVEPVAKTATPAPAEEADDSGNVDTGQGAKLTEPVVTSSSSAPEGEKPKKGGWWQKRGFFG